MAKLSLPELETLAINGGYTGLAALSNFSAVLLLSAASAWLYNYNNWVGADFDLTDDEKERIYTLVSTASAEVMMSAVGLIMPIATAAIPPFMLLCDGANHLRVDHPELYEVLDPVFIVDADNFVTPDLQDRFVMGSPTKPIGETGGSETHVLTLAESPVHSHLYQKEVIGIDTLGLGVPVPAVTVASLPTATTAAGSGNAHSILNPYIALYYGIVSGQ